MKKIIFTMIVALFAMTTVSAQEVGNWAVGPKIGIYTNTSTIFSIGAIGRYSFTDNWRVEPGIAVLCKKGCSVDINADVQYLFQVADAWNVYPLAGVSVNDIGGWSCGINLGGGADFSVADRWDITAGIKWMIQTAKHHPNPIIISLGATYKF
ncbi:MAG: porin family protein [Rikenellaceae bacterium]|nr:porin family protein [Rikenellaceae bacterium]